MWRSLQLLKSDVWTGCVILFLIYFVKLICAEALCNFYVQYGAGERKVPWCKEFQGKFRNTPFCLAPSFIDLSETKCGRLLKFCKEIMWEKFKICCGLRTRQIFHLSERYLQCTGSRYLCKGKINERNFGISLIRLADKMNEKKINWRQQTGLTLELPLQWQAYIQSQRGISQGQQFPP